MPTITLETQIKADIRLCFDLTRSIDLHSISIAKTNEKAIAGRMSGRIDLNEMVTWQANHFGITQKLTSKITAFDRPFHFRDEQQKGAFKFILHDHFFKQENGFVIMKDIFNFQSPMGYFGKLFDKTILTGYMSKFLTERNNVIKEYAETGKWKSILK